MDFLNNSIIDIRNIIFLVVIAANFSISFLLYFGSNKKAENITVFIFFLSIAFWVSGAFFFYNLEIVYRWVLYLLYIPASIAASTFLLFSLIFFKYKLKNFYFIIFLPNAAIMGLLLSGKILESVVNINHQTIITFDNFYFIYAIYISIYFLIGIIVLFLKLRERTKHQERILIFYFLIGTALSSAFGMVTNLILPWFGYFSLFWIGPVQTILLAGLITYLVAKHDLFNIKVIATELLTFLVWIVILIEVFLADTWTERFIEIGLLIFVVLFGVLIIKNVLHEVHIREKIENLAKKLEYANKKLKDIDDQKTEFMSLASHQLRTPLTSIKGYSSMIKSGDFGKISSEQKEPLDIIYSSTENMNNLIDDFLNASRIERKKGFDYNFVVDNPINLIKGIIDNISIQAKEKGIKFVYENKINKEVKIKFDNRTLLQAISNLIQNAIKYTNNGSITVKISRTNNHLEFSVKDSGIGMTSNDLKMLFKRFFRSESVKIDHPEGTGLGLYLAERIILDHGGKIWAKSKGIGKGSSFFITLPVVEK